MSRLYRAVRPGGWLVLGRMAPPPDPLAQAVSALRTIRGGGAEFDAKRRRDHSAVAMQARTWQAYLGWGPLVLSSFVFSACSEPALSWR